MQRKNGNGDLLGNGDVIEMMTGTRLFWITRERYKEVEAMSDMLEIAIQENVGISTIRHIFDEAEDFKEVCLRFKTWQTDGFKQKGVVVGFPENRGPGEK